MAIMWILKNYIIFLNYLMNDKIISKYFNDNSQQLAEL